MRVLFNKILLKMTENDQSSNTCQSFRINVKAGGGEGEGRGRGWRLKSQNSRFATDFYFKSSISETIGRRGIKVHIF